MYISKYGQMCVYILLRDLAISSFLNLVHSSSTAKVSMEVEQELSALAVIETNSLMYSSPKS